MQQNSFILKLEEELKLTNNLRQDLQNKLIEVEKSKCDVELDLMNKVKDL